MKKLLSLLMVGLGLRLLVPSASAQILPGSTNIADRVSRIILPGSILQDSASPSPISIRPPRPERQDLAPEIKQRIVRFERSRETYLARQEELLHKLRTATAEDRARIRAQLQALRDEWLDRARAFREEARTRMKELQDELPKYREALTDAKEGALDAVNPGRKRRGDEGP